MKTQNSTGLGVFGVSDKVFSTKMEIGKHIIKIDEEIGEASEYRDVIDVLLTSNPCDQIEIILQTHGGSVETAMMIVEAMRMSQADINVTVTGACHSAGTLIALNALSVRICDNAEFMIHSASWGVWGSSHNVKKQNDFIFEQMCALVDDTYEGFLTPSEIKEMKRGEEYWFNSEESRKRLVKRMAVLSKRYKQSQQ